MKEIISAVIFPLLLSAPCFSDTLASYVNERGQTVFTNSGPSLSEQAERTKEYINSVVDEIIARHPEIDEAKVERMIQLRDHHIKFGDTIDQALLKAEKTMIDDGFLIDHETVAADKRRQREAAADEQSNQRRARPVQKKKYTFAQVQDPKTKRYNVEEVPTGETETVWIGPNGGEFETEKEANASKIYYKPVQKTKYITRQVWDPETKTYNPGKVPTGRTETVWIGPNGSELETKKKANASNPFYEEDEKRKQAPSNMPPSSVPASSGPSLYMPAGRGRVDVQTGVFQADIGRGYVDHQTGAIHTKTGRGTVNTQTGQFSPGQ